MPAQGLGHPGPHETPLCVRIAHGRGLGRQPPPRGLDQQAQLATKITPRPDRRTRTAGQPPLATLKEITRQPGGTHDLALHGRLIRGHETADAGIITHGTRLPIDNLPVTGRSAGRPRGRASHQRDSRRAAGGRGQRPQVACPVTVHAGIGRRATGERRPLNRRRHRTDGSAAGTPRMRAAGDTGPCDRDPPRRSSTMTYRYCCIFKYLRKAVPGRGTMAAHAGCVEVQGTLRISAGRGRASPARRRRGAGQAPNRAPARPRCRMARSMLRDGAQSGTEALERRRSQRPWHGHRRRDEPYSDQIHGPANRLRLAEGLPGRRVGPGRGFWQ